MAKEFSESGEIRRGYLLGWILTGCEEGASRVLKDSLEEVLSHPAGMDSEKKHRLLASAVRRRSLKFPARNELPESLVALHRSLEPGRSLVAFQVTRLLTRSEAEGVLDLSPSLAKLEESKTIETAGDEAGLAAAVASLEPSPSPECRDVAGKFSRGETQSGAKNPAVIAVAAAFLLLICLLVWQLTGRAGVFPEEAQKIVELARKAGQSSFSPVDMRVEVLPDWFAMQGVEGVRIPDGLENLNAVGVRTFQHEGETVAQMAVLDGDRRMYLLSFPATPFGIGGRDSWEIAELGSYVAALSANRGNGFLITFQGSEKDMKTYLASLVAEPPATTP